MRGIQVLNPVSACFLQLGKIKPLAEMYNADIDDLVHELPQANRLLERTEDAQGGKAAFYELHRLVKISVMMPVTSAASERSFSALKLIKT